MPDYAVHSFTCSEFDDGAMPFSPEDYSKLKFGSDEIARRFGEELADGFFGEHADTLLLQPVVVIPSPYNYVKNAASVITEHFVNRLNHLLVESQGTHVDVSVVHRKVSYTHDYGFMTKEQRQSLIANDSFYLNSGFLIGKTLVFIDDIRITGTHEDRLVDILENDPLLRTNKVFYIYYAKMTGVCRAEVEAALNFAGVKNLGDFLNLTREPDHHMIVRPIKFLLSRNRDDFDNFISQCLPNKLRAIYAGCLGEGYYRIPEFQPNFLSLREAVQV